LEAEYDSIAEEYDATRESATEGETTALVRSLSGCSSILDVGVGTGRFASPLAAAGFDVTGVDISRRMLMKAKAKGLDRLVLGDAYLLPFASKSFDAAVIVHVLHVVVDWVSVMKEIGRVTRGPVVSIMRLPQGAPGSMPTASGAPFSVSQGRPARTQHRMWQNEIELKSRVPPVKLERIRDETISIPVASALRSLNAKRSMGAQIVPPEIREQMFERIVAMAGDQVVHRRIVEDLGVWKAKDLEALDSLSH
jgi:ubiquinone/menaquinone biosynthesis C-methylase UbiE